MNKLAFLACIAIAAILGGNAYAAVTPAILTSDDNRVPACVKPERLMEFVKERNKKLDGRLDGIAADYQTHGTTLGVRWDYAFFQMLVETNYLSFKQPNGKSGDVRPDQNNFAGLGATGNGVSGESFADVSTGVLGHLGHIRLYSGNPVDEPAAERTKLVTDIILPWAQGFDQPVTFTDLTKRWSPTDKGYSDDIENVAKAYRAKFCTGKEVEEEVAEAPAAMAPAAEETASVETATHKSDETGALSEKDVLAKKKMGLGVNPDETDASASGEAKTEVASLNLPSAPAVAPSGACKVFTASYGGSKALLIANKADGLTRYTALSVHEGKEGAQALAFINVYAKGGETVGTFATEDEALAKAFELCPES